MKRIIALFSLLLAANCFGQLAVFESATFGQADPPAASYLIEENFEGTGTPAGWTDTANGGTLDHDYTTTVLQGAQSLFLSDATSPYANTVSATFTTDPAYVYGYFKLRVGALPAAMTQVLGLRDGANARVNISMFNNGRLVIYGNLGGWESGASPVTAVTANTTWHVWYVVNYSGWPNTTVSIALSSDGTKPTAGDGYDSKQSNTSGGVDTLLLVSATVETIFDRVLIDDAPIGDNP